MVSGPLRVARRRLRSVRDAGRRDQSRRPQSRSHFNQFQVVGEIEERAQLWGQPGKIKVTGFLSHGRAALFPTRSRLPKRPARPPTPRWYATISPTGPASVSIWSSRSPRQSVVFARAGWADGTIEPWDFTDIDRTFSGGVSINGKDWGRPDDTIGIGGVVNGIAGVHRDYFNLGGMGILIGDGQLPNPGVEEIVEAYYSYALTASTRVSVDYQFIGNPGYNTDRGPANTSLPAASTSSFRRDKIMRPNRCLVQKSRF